MPSISWNLAHVVSVKHDGATITGEAHGIAIFQSVHELHRVDGRCRFAEGRRIALRQPLCGALDSPAYVWPLFLMSPNTHAHSAEADVATVSRGQSMVTTMRGHSLMIWSSCRAIVLGLLMLTPPGFVRMLGHPVGLDQSLHSGVQSELRDRQEVDRVVIEGVVEPNRLRPRRVNRKEPHE